MGNPAGSSGRYLDIYEWRQECAVRDVEIKYLKEKIAELTKVKNENEELVKLRKENQELKDLLEGANFTCNKIAELVGDHGQYRDLIEAVEIKLHEKENKY